MIEKTNIFWFLNLTIINLWHICFHIFWAFHIYYDQKKSWSFWSWDALIIRVLLSMTFNDDRVGSTTRIFGIHCVFVPAVPPHGRTVWFQIPTARLKLHTALNPQSFHWNPLPLFWLSGGTLPFSVEDFLQYVFFFCISKWRSLLLLNAGSSFK